MQISQEGLALIKFFEGCELEAYKCPAGVWTIGYGHSKDVKEGDKINTIRFGLQGVKTAGKPKPGESQKQKNRRKSFKARHAKNIAKGKMSAAYWANKVKW